MAFPGAEYGRRQALKEAEVIERRMPITCDVELLVSGSAHTARLPRSTVPSPLSTQTSIDYTPCSAGSCDTAKWTPRHAAVPDLSPHRSSPPTNALKLDISEALSHGFPHSLPFPSSSSFSLLFSLRVLRRLPWLNSPMSPLLSRTIRASHPWSRTPFSSPLTGISTLTCVRTKVGLRLDD